VLVRARAVSAPSSFIGGLALRQLRPQPWVPGTETAFSATTREFNPTYLSSSQLRTVGRHAASLFAVTEGTLPWLNCSQSRTAVANCPNRWSVLRKSMKASPTCNWQLWIDANTHLKYRELLLISRNRASVTQSLSYFLDLRVRQRMSQLPPAAW
jgi:hypothetical protein